jgi:maleate cis-trans isomerase
VTLRAPSLGEEGLTVNDIRAGDSRLPSLGFGWRGRIGFISPTVVEVKAWDFYRIAPPGLGFVGVTCSIEGWSQEQYDAGLAQVDSAARYLGSRGVNFVIQGGAPLVMSRGLAFDEELSQRMRDLSGVPSITTVRAAMDAMRHLGMRRIALATPYPPAQNEKTASYFQASGFDVVHQATLDLPFKEIQDVSPARIYRFILDVARSMPDADGLYMPCPQWSVCDVIDVAERDTGLPIVAGVTAEFWAAFRALGIRDEIRGYGRLLASLADESVPAD